MEDLNSILKRNNVDNVNVENNIYNNVNGDDNNVENFLRKIEEARDKPKAIGETLAKELNAPGNIKLYIKLAYQYPVEVLFQCLALAKEAERDGRIKTGIAQYFYGILMNKKL